MIKFSVRRGESGSWAVYQAVEGMSAVHYALTHSEADADAIANCLNEKQIRRRGPGLPVDAVEPA